MTALELAVQDVAGIAVASELGVDRIELCAALTLGGLTPSYGLIEAAITAPVPAHVLIRPRPGGFDYSASEHELMLADIRAAVRAGAAGVVIGATCSDVVDEQFVRAAVDSAEGIEVTFHRAFDLLSDRFTALETLADLGVGRILTSGGQSRAVDAVGHLAELVRNASGRIQIMAGGGIDAANAAALLEAGVEALHASAKRVVTEHVAVGLGSGAQAGESNYETTDREAAHALLKAVRHH